MPQLSTDFFRRNTVAVAKELLGKIMVVNGCKVRIVETEAYGRDPASHAFTKTDRSAIMYDTVGYVYVYLIYGMYHCINFTTENVGQPGAVLIRAAEPLTGFTQMKLRRETNDRYNLCSGPGKLCQALGIDQRHNNLPLGKQIKIYDEGYKAANIKTSSRIGIKDALHLPWRFFIADNEFVSKGKSKVR